MNICTYCKNEWRKHESGVYNHPTCYLCRESRVGETIEFVRFGLPPASGRSRNHATGEPEAGVSVYEIRAGKIQFVGWYFEFTSRPAYRGTGRIVGWGSDYEPLVEIIEISTKKLTKAQLLKLRS